jgi:hypothetical protein
LREIKSEATGGFRSRGKKFSFQLSKSGVKRSFFESNNKRFLLKNRVFREDMIHSSPEKIALHGFFARRRGYNNGKLFLARWRRQKTEHEMRGVQSGSAAQFFKISGFQPPGFGQHLGS